MYVAKSTIQEDTPPRSSKPQPPTSASVPRDVLTYTPPKPQMPAKSNTMTTALYTRPSQAPASAAVVAPSSSPARSLTSPVDRGGGLTRNFRRVLNTLSQSANSASVGVRGRAASGVARACFVGDAEAAGFRALGDDVAVGVPHIGETVVWAAWRRGVAGNEGVGSVLAIASSGGAEAAMTGACSVVASAIGA